MTGTAETEAIKTCYESLGMTPEQIAEDRGLEVTSVKACLMSSSSRYRKACGSEPDDKDDLNFTEDDLRDVNAVILSTAKYAEDPHLRFKAATYIRDDKKGRKEVVKQMSGNSFNILVFNEQMAKLRETKNTLLNGVAGNVVTIDTNGGTATS